MSQAGILDVVSSNPSIPTQFNAEPNAIPSGGSAIPIGNQLDLEGNTVANATHPKPVFITASGMTVVTNVQVGAAITGAPVDNNDAGLVSFDDTMFTVNENGYVQLIGGGAGIDSINVDANTEPGTDPVLPDGAGLITVTGAQVAAGTVGANVIRTNSLAENTYTIEIQRSTTNATPNIIKNGVSHFSSSHFSVDSSGFVTASGTGIGQTITGDSGLALSPTAGNWNILGRSGSKTSGALSTLTVKSPPYADASASATSLLNTGEFVTGAFTRTLPASAGLEDGDLLEYVCTSASALVIQAVGTQQIRVGSLVSSAAGTLTSTSIGDSISLRFRATDGFWYATSVIGTWLVA